MNETNNITTESAHQSYEKIVSLRKNINNSFWILVRELETARDNRIWAVLGHESWASFLAQPEIDLNENTVTDYIYILNNISKAINSSDMSDKMIPFDIDIGKLKLLAPHITNENAEELLEKAKTLSRSDLRQEIQEERNKKLPKATIPEGKFNVIYADPPWKYDFSETTTREIENQYPTMEIEEIKSLEIPSDENSVLFLWATAPKLLEAIDVLQSWGFTYKTHMVWDKQKIGMGYWFRGQHELLLVGVKGHFTPPAEELRTPSVYRETRTEHSKKPEYFYRLIESWYPEAKYLELFSRKQFGDRWTVFGNQL